MVFCLVLGSVAYADTSVNHERVVGQGYTKVASNATIFQLVSDYYVDNQLIDSKSIDVKGDYYTKKIKSSKVDESMRETASDIIMPMGELHEETFECMKYISDEKSLDYLFDMEVGADIIQMYCQWEETWLCNESGDKVKLEGRTDPIIYDAWHEFWVVPTVEMNNVSFSYTEERARSSGYITAVVIGGAKSYTHTVYPSYK